MAGSAHIHRWATSSCQTEDIVFDRREVEKIMATDHMFNVFHTDGEYDDNEDNFHNFPDLSESHSNGQFQALQINMLTVLIYLCWSREPAVIYYLWCIVPLWCAVHTKCFWRCVWNWCFQVWALGYGPSKSVTRTCTHTTYMSRNPIQVCGGWDVINPGSLWTSRFGYGLRTYNVWTCTRPHHTMFAEMWSRQSSPMGENWSL